MPRPRPLAFVLALLLAPPLAAEDLPKLSPYPGVRWEGETPEVEIDGSWLVLVAIDGTPVAEIVAFAKERHGGRWQKRFAEDLVQVLTEMGKPPGRTVTLVVRDPSGRAPSENDPLFNFRLAVSWHLD